MQNWIVGLGARWLGVSKLAAEAEDLKPALGGVVLVLSGLAGILGGLAGLLAQFCQVHGLPADLAFFQGLVHNPICGAIVLAWGVVMTRSPL